jgi:hypothetical protein
MLKEAGMTKDAPIKTVLGAYPEESSRASIVSALHCTQKSFADGSSYRGL